MSPHTKRIRFGLRNPSIELFGSRWAMNATPLRWEETKSRRLFPHVIRAAWSPRRSGEFAAAPLAVTFGLRPRRRSYCHRRIAHLG